MLQALYRHFSKPQHNEARYPDKEADDRTHSTIHKILHKPAYTISKIIIVTRRDTTLSSPASKPKLLLKK